MPILLIIWILIAFLGGGIASAKGRSFFGWFLICFFTGGLGIIFLLFLSSVSAQTNNIVQAINQNTQAIVGSTGVGYDTEKWANLLKYDSEIAQAAARLRQVAPQKENELAKSFLSLGDKSYLNAIVDRLITEG